jgi:hypothetical protein
VATAISFTSCPARTAMCRLRLDSAPSILLPSEAIVVQSGSRLLVPAGALERSLDAGCGHAAENGLP